MESEVLAQSIPSLSHKFSVNIQNQGLYHYCSSHWAQAWPQICSLLLCGKCWNNHPFLPHQVLAPGEMVTPKGEADTVELSLSRKVWMAPFDSFAFMWQWEKRAVCTWRIECKTCCKCCLYCLGQIKWLEGLTYQNKKTQMHKEKPENPTLLNIESFFDRFNLAKKLCWDIVPVLL